MVGERRQPERIPFLVRSRIIMIDRDTSVDGGTILAHTVTMYARSSHRFSLFGEAGITHTVMLVYKDYGAKG